MIKLLAFVVLASGVFSSPVPSTKLHPDAGLDAVELIQKHGYPLERHTIQTEDGYLLEVHRIPYGINSASKKPGFPVLLQHGLVSSSTDWINAGLGRSLAYALADMGFDIWLGNNRGNMWSRKHITLDPDVDLEKFWNYSYHELGVYDVTAMIDYILNENGAEQLFYIGHSQGTSQFFAMAAAKPEYNSKIRLMSALAPVVYMNHLFNPFAQFASKFEKEIGEWGAEHDMYEFLPHKVSADDNGCAEEAETFERCKNLYFLICGFDSQQLNNSMMAVINTNVPAGTSSKEFLHYAQQINSGKFQQYDYHSDEKNMEIYGQVTPPEYNLTQVTAPIALYYGQNDWLSSVVDVEKLPGVVPNIVRSYKIEFKYFNHGDFLWANDVFEFLYNDVIATMQSYM